MKYNFTKINLCINMYKIGGIVFLLLFFYNCKTPKITNYINKILANNLNLLIWIV